MNPLQLDAPSPLRFATEGDAVRRAASVLERESTRLATALRRALPFLARREIPITLAWARAITVSEVVRDLPRPVQATALTVEPGGAPGALVLDAAALGLILDGVLGGDGRALPALSPVGLTAPQSALVSRTIEGVVRAMGDVLSARAGIRIGLAPHRNDEDGGEGTPIVCAFELGPDASAGHVFLVLPKATLAGRAGPEAPHEESSDPRILRALDGVDIELVVELARASMPFERVLALQVGDTLTLDTQVGSSACVRIDDRAMFNAKPTTVGGRLGVRIEGRA